MPRRLKHAKLQAADVYAARQQAKYGEWGAWCEAAGLSRKQAWNYNELGKCVVTTHFNALPDGEQWREWQRIQGNLDDEDETNWVDKQCAAVEWYTPKSVLAPVRAYFGGLIPLDPATVGSNPTGALRFFTEADDGLKQDWSGPGIFVNPPYGEALQDWCEKIHAEADNRVPIVALLPCGARFGTAYWQEHVLNRRLDAICFHRGRIAFDGPDGRKPGNPYDSALYGFNVDRKRFAGAFSPLGIVLVVQEVLG